MLKGWESLVQKLDVTFNPTTLGILEASPETVIINTKIDALKSILKFYLSTVEILIIDMPGI